MRLKKHLHFVGDSEKNEITYHNINGFDENIVIEVDNYNKIWDYLNILSKESDHNSFAEWRKNYGVSDEELKELNNFLIENGIVYENYCDNKNIRTNNFFNNYIFSNNNQTMI